MTQSLLGKRVAALADEVASLKTRLIEPQRKDWRRTIGMFTDNPGMLEIFEEALKFRDENRRRTRPKPRRSRKPKQ